MKKETVLKTILVLMISVVLLAIPANVFAATGNSALDGFWEDQGGREDLEPETPEEPQQPTTPEPTTKPENTNTNTNTNKNTNTNTNTNKNTNTNIPKAGLAEDSMMVLAITVLGIAAVYAYKKVNEYKNI